MCVCVLFGLGKHREAKKSIQIYSWKENPQEKYCHNLKRQKMMSKLTYIGLIMEKHASSILKYNLRHRSLCLFSGKDERLEGKNPT
jgi:hypothetical protein